MVAKFKEGGLVDVPHTVLPFKRLVPSISADVSVSWEWFDESAGEVKWTFKNKGIREHTVVLFRNGYYFGNAFWAVYLANKGFDTGFAAGITALKDNGVDANAMPLGIIDFGNGQTIVAFLFTLAAGQTWSVLEGGFSSLIVPSGATVYEIGSYYKLTGCIKYDPAEVTQWDSQTHTTLGGYTPNPKTFNAVAVTLSGPYVKLWNGDSVKNTACPSLDCGKVFADLLTNIENAVNCFGEYKVIDMLKSANFGGMPAAEAFVSKLRAADDEVREIEAEIDTPKKLERSKKLPKNPIIPDNRVDVMK